MSRFGGLVLGLVALNVIVAAGVAGAQTVVVRNAPAGTALELRWNETQAGSTTAAPDGAATITFPAGQLGQPEVDARVLVDVCEAARRVTLVERTMQPSPPDPGCRRTDAGQFVLLRPTTSLLIDLGPATPTVWVRQGAVPPEWMVDREETAERPRRPAPTGVMAFVGGTYTNFGNLEGLACGGVTDCTANTFRPGFSVGGAYWPSQYFGLEGGFLMPSDATVTGSGTNYKFDTNLDSQVITASAVVGIPVGRVRFYGRGGATHHRATLHTTQTMDTRTIKIDGEDVVVEGGTQAFELRTAGWGWLFGGGMEAWLSRRFAIFGEGNYAALKGGARDDGEGEMDERITTLTVGVRFRLGG
ncbi:MAG: hypothetical protein H6Q10_668 [Acidobacteria bacterium]|nr:hypothetical protein [Acidobacteriota bacterium]